MEQPERSRMPVLPALTFIVIFLFAVVMILEVMPRLNADLRNPLEHILIAFMVASILGFTYEWLLNIRREETLRRLFEEHREKLFDSLRVHLLLSPVEVFDLLGDIACQTKEIPTLYRPPREQAKEYTFADRVKYFDTLIEVRRKDVTGVLRSWIRPDSHPNLKFLASDFIGMYKLCELAGDLRAEAYPQLEKWSQIESEKEQGWILNYIWAASRCDARMYDGLTDLLCTTPHEWIQKWILFVPRQMPGPEFGPAIARYLRRGDEVSLANRKEVVKSLAALQYAGTCDAEAILKKFANLFRAPELVREIEEAWTNLALNASFVIRQISKQH